MHGNARRPLWVRVGAAVLALILILTNTVYPWISLLPAPPIVVAQESPLIATDSAEATPAASVATPAPTPLDPLDQLENLLQNSSPSSETIPPEAIPEATPSAIPEVIPEVLKQNPRHIPITGSKPNQKMAYSASDSPQFRFTHKPTTLSLTDPRGKTTPIDPITLAQDSSASTLDLTPPTPFIPGKYTLTTENVDKNTQFQEFYWGVLALNTAQDVYRPGEIVNFQLGSLDARGHTLCSSNLELKVQDLTLSTATQTIIREPSCGPDNVTDSPDYTASFTPSEVGIYALELTNLDTGFTLNTTLTVEADPAFIITRRGATRINPKASYTHHFSIYARDGFVGTARESVPSTFPLPSVGELSWDLSLEPGETQEFSYVYQAPLISPQYYFLGPLKLTDPLTQNETSEQRSWQIASDAILTYIGSAEADGTDNNSTWVEVADLWGDDTTRDANLSVNYKIMSATPDTEIPVNVGSTAAYGAVSVVHAWRGVDQTTPLDATTTTATGANSAIFDSPSISPTTAGTQVLSIGLSTAAASAGDTTITAPTGYTNQVDHYGNGSTFSTQVGIASKAWTSGAEDPAAWTDITTSTSDSWTAATMALRPAAGSLTYIGSAENSSNTPYSVDISGLSLQAGDLVIIATGWTRTGNDDPGVTLYDIDLTSLSLQAGDLIVVGSGWAHSTDGDPGVHTAGYTEVADLYRGDSRDANLSVSYKIMGATPDSVVTLRGTGYQNPTYGAVGVAHAWRGVDQTTPLDATTTTATGANSAVFNSPSISPTTTGVHVLSVGLSTAAASAGDTTITAPTGYTNQADHNGDGTAMSAQAGIASKAWTSGAEDPAAWADITTASTESWAAATLAIKPGETLTLSGTANGSEGATVRYAVNSTLGTPTGTISSGAWEITDVPLLTANDIITVWIDNVADGSEATAVTKWSSGDITGLVLNTNTLTLGSNQNTSLSLTNLNQYDCTQDEDIMHQAASDHLKVQGDSCAGSTTNAYDTELLSTLSGDTLTLATTEAITTYDLSNAGTLTVTGNGVLNVAHNWTNTGTFTSGTSTLNLTGGDSTTQTITGNTSFYHLVASTNTNSSSRTLRFTAGSTTTVTGTWTVTGYSGKIITLESSAASAWTINPTAAAVTYVSTSYSNNTGTQFCATYSTNGGNNTGWNFSANTTCQATNNSFQRRTWYDGTRYWRSTYNVGSARIEFEYSADGSSWTENTGARISTTAIDFALDADSSNAFIAYKDGFDIKISKASTYPGISFTWGAATTNYDGTSSTDTFSYPTLARDSSGIVWVTATHLSGTNYLFKAIASTTANTITAWSTASTLNTTANSNSYGLITPRTSGNMYATWFDGTAVEGSPFGRASGWYDSNWSYRKKLTIDYTKVQSANQTDFTVLVNRTDVDWKVTGSGGHVGQADGGDFVFTSSDGTTKLNHEIEKYVSTTGELVAWVKVPTLSYTANTELYLYYGNAGSADQWNITGTWSSETAAVWHLKESGNGTTDEYKDSTSVNDATGGSSAYPTLSSSGQIDGAQDFDGINDIITAPHDASLVPSSYLTVSAWVKFDTLGIDQHVIRKFCSTCTGSTSTYAIYLTTTNRVYFEIEDTGGVDISYARTGDNAIASEGVWYHIVGFWNATDGMKIYINNVDSTVLVFDPPSGTLISTTDTLRLGAANTSSGFADGMIDEVKILNVGKNANWVATEYNNQSSPSTFYSVSSEESGGWGTTDSIGTGTTGLQNSLSAVGDSSGYVHLVYINDSGQTIYRKYTTSWQTAVTLDSNSGNTYPTLTLDTNASELYAFWVRSEDIFYKVGASPYASGDWDASATSWQTTGTNTYLSSNYSGSDKIFAQWHDGTSIDWDKIGASSNTAPNSPSSLLQLTAGDVTLATGAWHNSTSLKFSATASDTDNPDTLYLCIEIDQLATSFSNTEDSCGSGVAYSGTGVSVTHTLTVTDAQEYHWQARVKDTAGAYSAWVSYDVNAESARDVGVDTTAPTGGTIYDGESVGVDTTFATSSLSSLSANWASFNTDVSGLLRYDYSIGTSAGATDIKAWTDNSTTTSVTATGLTLQTSQLYYVNVRAVDNAGNVQGAVSSNGQLVAPSISFAISPATTSFSNLSAGNSYEDSKTTTLTTSTNAYNGYVIRAFTTDLLKSIGGTHQIANFSAGSYASPATWSGSETGFGYTSSDPNVQGSDKFGSGTLYAPFSQTGPGDIIADHTSTVAGTSITNETFDITYKVKVPSTQAATNYTSTVVYTATAQY